MSNDCVVIIPTLNAASTLPATLRGLGGVDILVVDGGSTDGTVAVAEAAGARVMRAPRGRGAQLAAGVAATTAPWLLLLHADTRLEPGWRNVVDAFTRVGKGASQRAGYFRFALDSPDPRARRLERAVAWRCRMLRLPYGDQGLLVARDLLHAVGGIKPLPLMEDVDLTRRLRAYLTPLDSTATTSAIRWERDGWILRSVRNGVCLVLWYAGIPPTLIARLYR